MVKEKRKITRLGRYKEGISLDKSIADAITDRHSVRKFDNRCLTDSTIELLKQACIEAPRLMSDGRAVMISTGAETIFTGPMLKNVPACLALVGPEGNYLAAANIGYIGEYLVLKATSLGLGTCWVTGTFRSEKVNSLIDLNEGEKVIAVVAMGYSCGKAGLVERIVKTAVKTSTRKPLNELMKEGKCLANHPQWVQNALEAARWAPSAMNRQPWRFEVDSDGIRVFPLAPENAGHWLDCGIAMAHLEISALTEGIQGQWTIGEQSGARFTPHGGMYRE